MKRTDTSTIEEYVRKISPHLIFYYRAAHVIAGNREEAEVILSMALSRFFSSGDPFSAHSSVRSGVLHEIRAASEDIQRKKNQKIEMDWPGLNPEKGPPGPIVEYISSFPLTVQRYFVMRFGYNLPIQQISRLTEVSPDAIKKGTARVIRGLEKALKKNNTVSNVREQQIAYEIRQHMHRENEEPIDVGHILHTLEDDLINTRPERHTARKALRLIVTILFTALMVFLLWFFAVLMEI